MNLPDDAKKIIDLLLYSGYSAYAVGGCVRDAFMERKGGDVDITTSALPEQTESVLSNNGIRYIETGLKHGTVTAVLNGENYEITTFRTDGSYLDNRHPDSVNFVTDIKEDLARRDFTVNAMAYNDRDGVLDVYGGKQDIDRRLIRCVGDPDRRFNEDALRIMRALRFASVLGFEIEPDTSRSIISNKDLLKNIAAERIFVELKKLLLGDNVERILTDYRDVIAVIIPELKPCFDFPQNSKWHIYDVYTHIVKTVADSPKKDYIRFAMLFHDIGKPFSRQTDADGDHFKGHPAVSLTMTEDILRRLKVSNDFYKKVTTLVSIHDAHIHRNPVSVKTWLSRLGENMIYDFLDVKIADMMSHNLTLAQHELDELRSIKDYVPAVIASGEPYLISHLAIHGNDLVPLGYKGKEISDELNTLLSAVISVPSQNTKTALLARAKADKSKNISR
ncbi:MAG: HD domain-containing protein [Oscillospiraceae bacterium]|nr:HD domain-containing protein [Oscillospiraceae bacterium]